jgi:hypothetical protein
MRCRRRALPQRPALLIHLEFRALKVFDNPLGMFATGIIRGVFAKEPTEKVPAAPQGEADREY